MEEDTLLWRAARTEDRAESRPQNAAYSANFLPSSTMQR